ncbi:hypothetical protein N8691_03855 [Candidatus Pelagibacter sp.]|nr:hypothetical protein [Candidatus Pelagibacter sp.]
MKSDNNWYGHRNIFAEYIGIKNIPCFSTIQHGYLNKITLQKLIKSPKIKFIPYLSWNLEVKNKFKGLGFNNVYIVGAPFVYLSKILKLKKKKKNKKVLFFPPHNTIDTELHNLKNNDLYEKLSKTYEKKNITVCLYYSDFKKKKIVNFYKKKGFKVISIVSRSDDNCLKKLYLEISKNDKIIVCDVTTVLFYSMFLKKKVRVLLKGNNEFFFSDTKTKDEKKFILYFKRKYPSLFRAGLDPNVGYELACKHLGFHYLKSKEDLKKILGWNSIIKMLIAKCISFYYDVIFSKELRLGKKVIKN